MGLNLIQINALDQNIRLTERVYIHASFRRETRTTHNILNCFSKFTTKGHKIIQTTCIESYPLSVLTNKSSVIKEIELSPGISYHDLAWHCHLLNHLPL